MSKRQYLGAAILLCLLNFALTPRTAVALDLAGTAWAAAAAPYALDPALLYAIGLMESGRPRDGGLAPWPWTLYLPGQGGVFLASRAQALSTLRANLGTAVDIGLMQVNLRWHGHRVAHPEELLTRRATWESRPPSWPRLWPPRRTTSSWASATTTIRASGAPGPMAGRS